MPFTFASLASHSPQTGEKASSTICGIDGQPVKILSIGVNWLVVWVKGQENNTLTKKGADSNYIVEAVAFISAWAAPRNSHLAGTPKV